MNWTAERRQLLSSWRARRPEPRRSAAAFSLHPKGSGPSVLRRRPASGLRRRRMAGRPGRIGRPTRSSRWRSQPRGWPSIAARSWSRRPVAVGRQRASSSRKLVDNGLDHCEEVGIAASPRQQRPKAETTDRGARSQAPADFPASTPSSSNRSCEYQRLLSRTGTGCRVLASRTVAELSIDAEIAEAQNPP